MASRAFVGREEERAQLAELLREVRAGRSRALAVVGPPGAGKSALLAAALAAPGGPRVLRTVGVESETELPFAALDALLRPVLALRERLPSAQAAALEQALALAPRGPADAYAVAAATLSLLAAAAEEEPLLCVVDDAHWIDAASRDALTFAARRLAREGLGLLFASRTELPGVGSLVLGPLAAHDARALLGPAVPAELAAQLVESADGNPLALLELVARLSPEQLGGRATLVGPPPPAARAEALLSERIAALPDRAASALLVLGASGDGRADVIAAALAALGLGPDDLEPAEAAGLVRIDAGRIEAGHPLVRSVAYHRRPAAERRRAHAAVAAALGPADPRTPWHRAAAATAPDEDIAAALEAGAADARRRGGHAAAARALHRAAELTPDQRDRAVRFIAAAEAFAAAGRIEEAAAELDLADQLPADAARLETVRGTLALHRGRPRDARASLLAGAAALAAADPHAAARALHDAIHAGILLGLSGELVPDAERALALAAGDDRLLEVSRALLAVVRIAAGEPLPPGEGLEELRETVAAIDLRRAGGATSANASVLLVHALRWVGEYAEAEALLDRLVEQARALSALSALPYLLGQHAVLDLRRGRLARALARAEESLSLAEATGQGVSVTGSLTVRAGVAALTGDDALAVADARRALALAGDTAPRLRVFAHHALGLLALGQGEIDDAVEHLDAAVAAHAGAGIAEPAHMVWVPDHVEALIRQGDTERAEPLLRDWERAGERLGRPFVQATAARCRGLLVADARIEGQFAAALRLHDDLDMPFERARTLLCLGERLRRARRRVDARAPLREALARFEAAGAPHWARRARVELRATGGMVPAVSAPETAELTPHEVQVALMAAEGRTNREIAAALFLAPKTIEHHLSTIFRKLGIKRRAELARIFAAELGPR